MRALKVRIPHYPFAITHSVPVEQPFNCAASDG